MILSFCDSIMHVQTLTELALHRADRGIFTITELMCWLGSTPARHYGLLKRALAAGEILKIRRGLYCLHKRYLQGMPDSLELAQRIYGPSYISLESALAHHGWIPEAVYATTSASFERSREFETPLGLFSYARVPQRKLYEGVSRMETARGGSFFLAAPLKALSDYVYVHRCDWRSVRPLTESLRIEEGALAELPGDLFDRLRENYRAGHVRRFLDGLRKDLQV